MKANGIKKFNPYLRPYCGQKPSKINKVVKTIWSEEFYSYSQLRFPDNLSGGTFEIGSISSSDDGNSVEISYSVQEEVENKNYDKQLESYNKAMEEIKEWEVQKKIYDKEQKEKQEALELKNYLRLKKKYGDK